MKYKDMSSKFCAYPFLYDDDFLADYEILTDSLSSSFGYLMTDYVETDEIYTILKWLSELSLHANPAMRLENKITVEEVAKLDRLYSKYYVADEGLFIPFNHKKTNGLLGVATETKVVIRMLQVLYEEGHEVDELLLAFLNLLSNFCVTLSKYIYFNREKGDDDMNEESRFMACPYLYETGFIIDFELMTENLANSLGFMTTFFNDDQELYDLFVWLTENAMKISQSVRNECLLTEEEVVKLVAVYETYNEPFKGREVKFTLPVGTKAATILNVVRADVKAVIRMMYHLTKEGTEVSHVLFDYMNLLANLCYVLTRYINEQAGVVEIEFSSRHYK
jgi:cob(I)alamin adenosyltransferase